jgi:hypothetical protein
MASNDKLDLDFGNQSHYIHNIEVYERVDGGDHQEDRRLKIRGAYFTLGSTLVIQVEPNETSA